jgi:enterochelin esterase-like enzyme
MKIVKIIIISLLFTNIVLGQKYLGYSNDSIKYESKYLKQSIILNLHIPETFNFSAKETKYPITIIFDSQHEKTYPQIISSIDLLTNESQMPENIIIGIPFNRNNRYYLTSNKKSENDSLAGIERMEKFLFEELIPKLQNEYKANEFITVIGHSRTAFLVNYLTIKRSEKINIAIALSGFYSNNPLSVNTFKTSILNPKNFPNKIRYYFTAGSTLEEESYFKECIDVFNFISKNKMPKNFNGYFTETSNANHMTNYWVSLPSILMDCYADYNNILNNWFHTKLKNETISNPIIEFESDLDQAGKDIGFEVNPNLTHIFSLASSYGYEKKNYQKAVDFIKLGQKYYPNYLDFDLELIEYYKLLKNLKLSNFYKNEYRNKVMS